MNKLSKDKRSKVILVWIITATVVSGWGFGALSWQFRAKEKATRELSQKRDQFTAMTNLVSRAEEIEGQMQTAAQKLGDLESKMAGGDVYSWVINTVRDFKQTYKEVNLPQFSQVTLSENTLLPKFPYQQASLTVAGSAHFYDLGMFVSSFENQFPFARIINLDVEPGPNANTTDGDRERLNFKLDLIFLVKPNAS
jgi:hypothetical protein